jgi:hypothetical protein
MILAGLAWAFIASRMSDREPVRVYPFAVEVQDGNADEQKKAAERNRRRTMRNKLK